MKIVTVVGARPQFIKAAVVSRELRKRHEELLVHTGQHYDYNMSDIFFEELDIPKPKYNLGISGGSHGKMTGQMLIKLEEVLLSEKPDAVLLYGDTNSTMAGALAAVKLHIPVIHVEAGNRLGTKSNPEEINRIVTDHVSSLHLCCTESAKEFLQKEGIEKSAIVVGDPMYDAFLYYSEKVGNMQNEALKDAEGRELNLPDKYYYMTCHREENAGSDETIVRANGFKKILCCRPVGYLMSVYLTNHCEKIVTDSGGLQREAFFAKKQCVTIFDYIVWPETMRDYRNQLAKPDRKDILLKFSKKQVINEDGSFGDGMSSRKIVSQIEKFLEKGKDEI